MQAHLPVINVMLPSNEAITKAYKAIVVILTVVCKAYGVELNMPARTCFVAALLQNAKYGSAWGVMLQYILMIFLKQR